MINDKINYNNNNNNNDDDDDNNISKGSITKHIPTQL